MTPEELDAAKVANAMSEIGQQLIGTPGDVDATVFRPECPTCIASNPDLIDAVAALLEEDGWWVNVVAAKASNGRLFVAASEPEEYDENEP